MSNAGRWVVTPQGLVPANEYYARKDAERHGKGAHVMPDIASFISPLDGKEISSRSTLREHERRHNVRQVGNDLKLSDYNAATSRQTFRGNERVLAEAAGRAANRLGIRD